MTISKEQQEKINETSKKLGLELVIIFGSRANNTERYDSDLDIGIIDSKEENYHRFGELFSAFSDIFKGYNVDIRFLKDADPVFLYEAFQNSQLIYGDLINYFNYKAYSYKNYIDHKSLFELKSKLIHEKQQQLNKKINAK